MRKILFLICVLVSNLLNAQTTTWNGTTWSNGNPNSTLDVVINGNYTVGVDTPSTELNCNTLTINSGVNFIVSTNFYIDIWGGDFINNGNVTFQSTTDVIMRNGVIVNNSGPSNFIFQDGSALIQTTNTLQTTPVTFQRTTKPVKVFEYTYWGTPVTSTTLNTLPPSTTSNTSFSYNFPTPLPLNGWVQENLSNNMVVGKGYAVRGPWCSPYPSCFISSPQNQYTMNFVGIPNNGNISFTSTSSNRIHLVSNPYPSTINAVDFMLDNTGGGTRVQILYFWTHNTILSSAIPGNWVFNYTQDDYAVITRSGGTFIASSAPSPINDSTVNNNSIPSGNVASGQGFFVRMRDNGSKTFNFRNSQRGFLPFSPNTQFYREIQQTSPSSKLWLYLSDNEYLHRNMLVSYIDGATNEYDDGFEAEVFQNSQACIYSILNEDKLVIQGRENLISKSEKVEIGYKTFKPGEYTIGIHKKEGYFNTHSVILYDKLLGKYQNIKQSPYKFSTDSGEFNNRFEITYIEDVKLVSETKIYTENDDLVIENPIGNIDEVKVYDVLGRLLYQNSNIGNNITYIIGLPNKIPLIVNVTINKNTKSLKYIK